MSFPCNYITLTARDESKTLVTSYFYRIYFPLIGASRVMWRFNILRSRLCSDNFHVLSNQCWSLVILKEPNHEDDFSCVCATTSCGVCFSDMATSKSTFDRKYIQLPVRRYRRYTTNLPSCHRTNLSCETKETAEKNELLYCMAVRVAIAKHIKCPHESSNLL